MKEILGNTYRCTARRDITGAMLKTVLNTKQPPTIFALFIRNRHVQNGQYPYLKLVVDLFISFPITFSIMVSIDYVCFSKTSLAWNAQEKRFTKAKKTKMISK